MSNYTIIAVKTIDTFALKIIYVRRLDQLLQWGRIWEYMSSKQVVNLAVDDVVIKGSEIEIAIEWNHGIFNNINDINNEVDEYVKSLTS